MLINSQARNKEATKSGKERKEEVRKRRSKRDSGRHKSIEENKREADKLWKRKTRSKIRVVKERNNRKQIENESKNRKDNE